MSAFNETSQEDLEHDFFISVVATFKYYRDYANARIDKRLNYIHSLSESQRNLLCNYRASLEKSKSCVDNNQFIISKMLQNVQSLFFDKTESIKSDELQNFKSFDTEKVDITLRQLERDWSSSGKTERNQCYKPILDELDLIYDPSNMKINDKKVLVPGAGLGRLVYEIAMKGFFCEGNEISLFMLIASHFVLNKCPVQNQYELYPNVLQFVNNKKRSDQLRSVQIPDISTVLCRPTGELNMIAGDFIKVYGDQDQIEKWDAVCTSFFIDCANNILDFIEIIYRILKPNGIFINLGPLLYHFSDVDDSIEPSYEDLREILIKKGFKIKKERLDIDTKYAQNLNSMQQLTYQSVFFVCQKPE